MEASPKIHLTSASRQLQVCNLQGINDCDSSSRPCVDFDIEFCSNVNCIDTCQGSSFTESGATCQGDGSCEGAAFRQSEATCAGPDSCLYASFFNSAVGCPRDNPSGSCRLATWYQCNCCLNSAYCPDDVPLCVDPQTATSEAFCSSTFLGRSCKDWGNPTCISIEVDSLLPIHPASGCSAGKDIVNCDDANAQPCADFGTMESCAVNCIDSCQGVTFLESTIVCQGDGSCEGAAFRQSEAKCAGPDSCLSASFFNSAVGCPRDNPSGSCRLATWYQCNCCLNSAYCPDDVPLCVDPQTGTSDAFCNTLHAGQTCKEWGNPICKDSLGSSLIPVPALQPTAIPLVTPTPTPQPTVKSIVISTSTPQPTVPGYTETPTHQPVFVASDLTPAPPPPGDDNTLLVQVMVPIMVAVFGAAALIIAAWIKKRRTIVHQITR